MIAVKVVLVQPARNRYGTQAETHWELTRPLSLLYLAAALAKDTSCEVVIIDFEQQQFTGKDVRDVLRKNQADLFGITATTFTRFGALSTAAVIKELHPQAMVITGGVHFMHCAADTLKHARAIDLIVRGEGERTLVDLVRAIAAGEEYHHLPGISFRIQDRIVENPGGELCEDLDGLPLYDGFRWEDYPEYLMDYPEKIPALSVMSTRGCPYHCIFCAKAGMKYRRRNPSKMVDELQRLKERFSIRAVNFLDLTFTAHSEHVRTLCREMITRRLHLLWWCESRVNIPLDLLPLMKEAGCVSLVIGVEAGSPQVLGRIAKAITPEQVLSFCRRCHELGIFVSAYFMYSHPGETRADVEETLDLMDRLAPYTQGASLQPTMIFPGTELEGIARRQQVLPPGFSWCNPYDGELNRRLGQLANVPLYRNLLSEEEMLLIQEEFRIRNMANRGAAMSAGQFVRKAWKAVKKDPLFLKDALSPTTLGRWRRARKRRRDGIAEG